MQKHPIYQTIICALLLGGLLLPQQGRAQLTANFVGSPLSGCGNTVVQFTNQSTGNPTGFSWQVFNAGGQQVFSSNLANPTFLLVPGTYSICLTVTNGGNSNQFCRNGYVQINAQPQAAIQAAPVTGCSPLLVQYTDASAPGTCPIVAWAWNFGDGNTSTQQNPTHTYISGFPTSYTPTLSVTDACGCTSIIASPALVSIGTPPTANFTFAVQQTCTPPITVTFTNTSTPGLNYLWAFGDGTTSTQASPTHAYATSGTYQVTLTATNPTTNCFDVVTQTVVAEALSGNVNFSASSTQVCVGQTVTFTDLTTGGTVSNWQWNFGNGNTSNLQNPSITYNAVGCYTVTLSATVGGCPGTFTLPTCVNVGNQASLNPTFTVAPSCNAPYTVSFQSSPPPGATLLWDFGNGTTSGLEDPTVTYNAAGNYTVTLISGTGNCTSQDVLQISLQPINAQIGPLPQSDCAPMVVNLFDASTSVQPIVGWQWTVTAPNGTVVATSNQQNPTNIILQDTGRYDVQLVVTDAAGCTDAITLLDTIAVGTQLNVNFTATPLVTCVENQVAFTNLTQGNITRVVWQFGDGTSSIDLNPMHEYQDVDTFDVSLTVFNYGCDTTYEIEDYILILPPLAAFEPTFTCGQDSQYIVCFSSANSIGADRYSWNFGTGNPADTSNLANPCFDYTAYGRGVYTVTLTVFNDTTNCSHQTTQSVRVTDPLATFDVLQDTGCAPFLVPLANNSLDAAQYLWTAPGSTLNNGTAALPNITYPTPGYKFPIQLIITDIHGCRDTAVYDDTIFVSRVFPNFGFTDAIGCTPLSVTFTDSSTTFLGTITNLTWTFFNGQPNATGPTATAFYNTPGVYNVRLTATNSLGCARSLLLQNIIQATFPFPGFNYNALVCAGQPVNFSNTSTGANLTYHWDFGTGNPADTSNLANPSFAYAADGVYTVCLTALDENNCDSTICQQVTVASPVAAFNASDTLSECPPLLVSFTSLSQNAVGWLWDFGDGNGFSSTLQNPAHNYTEPGNYTVTLIAISPSGCQDTLVVPDFITVEGPSGNFSFAPSSGCAPLSVNFLVNYVETDTITLVSGDGGAVTVAVTPNTGIANINYTYLTPGSWVPAIQLKDVNGCLRSVISPTPVQVDGMLIDFNVNDSILCANDCAQFSQNILTLQPLNGIEWQFPGGNPATSTANNPSVCYATPGTYDVVLIASNPLCTDTLTVPIAITVGTYPLAAFGFSPDSSCVPVAVAFSENVVSPDSIASYAWDFDNNGTTDDGNPNTQNIFPTAGSFPVNLVATTVFGCADSASLTVTTLPIPTADAGAPSVICLGQTVNLQAIGGVAYQWAADPSLSNPALANPVATPTLTTTYTVTVTAANGCTAADNVTITVNALPVAAAGADQALCNGQTASLNATASGGSGGGYVFAWPSGPGATTTVTPALPGQTYTVTVTDANGCTDTDDVFITVNPLPQVSVAASPALICLNQSTTVTATANVPGSFLWSTGATTASIVLTPPTAGNTLFSVTFTDGNGCTASASGSINVQALPVADAGPLATICLGQNTTLQATGGVSYQWAAAPSLSTLNVANPVATPTGTTTYTVTVTGANGCTASDTVTVLVNPLPVANAGTDQAVCDGQSATLNATASGGSGGGYVFAWPSGPGATANVTPALPGQTYTVTVTDGNGCTDTDAIFVTVNALPQLTITANPNNICLLQPASLTATANVAGSFLWSTGATTAAITLTPPNVGVATATVTFTDGNGCSVSATGSINVQALPLADAGPLATICLGQNTTLQATGGVSYQWAAAPSLSALNVANPVATPTNTTTYTVTVTGANGCTASDTLTVLVNPLPIANAGADQAVCDGQTATLNATATGGSGGGYVFAWPSGPGATATVLPALPGQTYTVTVTDGNGCTDTDAIFVTVNALPQLTITANPDTICLNQSSVLTISANQVATFLWSTAATTASITVTPLVPNNNIFTVTATNANGCTASATQTVNVQPLPPADAGLPTAICLGQNTTLQATGGVSYQWAAAPSLSALNVANPVATPTTTTTYTVTVTGANGCTASDNVTITVNSLPVANAGQDTAYCDGGTATLNASATSGTGPYTFAWSAGAGQTINVTPAVPGQTYTLTVTDANGCTDTDIMNVTVFALPTVSTVAQPDSLCRNLPSVLNATGSGPGVYAWSTGQNGASVTTVPAQNGNNTYSVTFTDSNGCSSSTVQNVFVYALPNATANANTTFICQNDSVFLQASPTGAGFTYQWSGAATLNNPTISNPIGHPGVSTFYSVTVTDANGCSNSAGILVDVSTFALPVVNISPNTIICAGTFVQLTVSGGFNNTTAYTWDTNAAGLSCYVGCSNPLASPTVPTTYCVTVEGQGGCTQTACVFVDVINFNVTVAPPDTTICAGQTIGLSLLAGSNPVWSPAQYASCPTCPTTLLSPPVTTDFIVTVQYNGCPITDTLTVTVLTPEDVSAGRDTFLCIGDTVVLQGVGPGNVQWTPALNTIGANTLTPSVFPSTSTNYILSLRNGNCTLRDTVRVEVFQQADVRAANVAVCLGDTAYLSATGVADTYEWSPATGLSDPNSADPTAFVQQTTQYILTGYMGSCPPGYDTVTVGIYQSPTLPGDYTQGYVPGQTVTLTVTNDPLPLNYDYQWIPADGLSCADCAAPSVTPDSASVYTLIATDINGCADTMQFRLRPILSCDQQAVVVPNAFSPNSDGQNDVFYVRSSTIGSIQRFSVFDRWGKEVFTTDNMSEGWDGTYEGKPAQGGVFVWFVQYPCPVDGAPVLLKGNVTLIR